MEKYNSIIDQIDVYLGIADNNNGLLSEIQCKHLRELMWDMKPYGEKAQKWIKSADELLDKQQLKALVVANNCGKLPKRVIKQLKQVSSLNWRYETSAHCYVADLNNYNNAKFISMKIIAILTGELPECYCSYLNIAKNTTLFTVDRLNGYSPRI